MTGGPAGEPPRNSSPDLDTDPAPDDPTPPTGVADDAPTDVAAADTDSTDTSDPSDASVRAASTNGDTPRAESTAATGGDDLPPPGAPDHAADDEDRPPPIDGTVEGVAEAHEPAIPRETTAAPPPTAATPLRATSSGAAPTGVAYRSTHERNRSVYRRANPWYRQLARGLVAATLIGALGIGVYLGARELRDYLDRDRLPAAGAEVPEIRGTSMLVTSTSPAAPLQGTIIFDVDTGAFEFTGTPATSDAGVRLTSPDGTTVYREDGPSWLLLPPEDARASAVREAIRVLDDDETADAILVNRLRRGHVDLVRQVEEGTGDERLTRYDIALDLTGFADAFPVQWNEFRVEAIPGVVESRRHVVSIWLDDEDVLMRVDDPDTGWSWQRLTYSSSAFEPFRPAPAAVVQSSTAIAVEGVFCSIEQFGVGWTTGLNDCVQANTLGRELAVGAGLADDASTPAAELAFASTCVALQDGQTVVEDAATLALAEQLDAAEVCPGDVERLRASLPTGGDTATTETTVADG